jgi:phosphoglycolate phosphatase
MALRRALELEFGLAQAATEVDFSGRTDRAILEEILISNDLPNDAHHFGRLRNRYVAAFPKILQQHGGNLMPGALDLLVTLRGFDHLLCHVMTGNLTETATHKLEHFGLRQYVSEIFGGEHDLHRDHLAKRTVNAIRRQSGDRAIENLIVVGDTPADIRCAYAVGAEAIAVCTGRYTREELALEKPTAIYDDLSDLPRVLPRLIGNDP